MKRSLRSWLWRVDIDQEVDEELAFHVEMRTRELVEKGLDPPIAREMVLARVGDVGRLKRTCVDLGRKRDREMRLTRWLEELRDDVRFAVRQLKSAPGFTFVAAITLALGIRANGAIFALADAVTVLAANAAVADAAATLIANAVSVDSPAVQRRPARALDPDSDLRDLPVTVSVGPLTSDEADGALARGLARAAAYLERGLIIDAALMLAGRTRTLRGLHRAA